MHLCWKKNIKTFNVGKNLHIYFKNVIFRTFILVVIIILSETNIVMILYACFFICCLPSLRMLPYFNIFTVYFVQS